MTRLPKIICIVGPTASGKSGFGIKLAKKFNGEIISVDSRQIYKEMNIGTGKVRPEEMDGIKHYMIDILKPNQGFTVAQYKDMAEEIIDYILKRNKLPILVGGTGLYMQAIVDNFSIPRVVPDKKLRAKLEKQDIKILWKKLLKLDPGAKKVVQKENKRRIVRALEVCLKTGKPFTEQTKKRKPKYNVLQIVIKVPREKLYKRIDKRVDQMIKDGLVDEVKKLTKKYSWKWPAMSGIGYGEFKGEINRIKDKEILDEIIQQIKYHSHQYAKRQESWFKRDKKIKWVKNYKQAETLAKKFLK